MILYFASRTMEILGLASTNLQNGFVIFDDCKTEEIESGVATFECNIGFNKDNRNQLEEMAKAGNYILRKNNDECEFYTIIDFELDTKKQEVTIYAEDAGLDLINEIAVPYEATEAHPAEWYVNKWIIDSGFEIGINEIPASSTRKLSWDGESTVTERLASIATQFDGYEVSYSFEVKGLEVVRKYVNFFKERGKDIGAKLRLNYEVDRITIKQSVANLATALRVTGGTPEESEEPITLVGYTYDDGDFYVGTDGVLRSRKANEKWSRYVWNKEPNIINGYAGHIIRSYSYDTTNQKTLCAQAVTELKKICDMEVNYEVDISELPDNVKIGDRVDIIDNAGDLYFSARILLLETSITEGRRKATIGEYLIKDSGISMQVQDLARELAAASKSATQAKKIADVAKTAADQAQETAGDALTGSNNAIEKANEAQAAASTATQSAAAAQQAANNAVTAAENVEKNVENIETTVSNVQKAADNAQQAAETAGTKADEAATAAAEALADAADAKAAVEVAQSTANTATSKAEAAQSTANTAKSEAATAQATADAAKLDAAKANEDIATLGENLETVSQTMQADYARKTELTEAKASLQTQITQNANEISSTASKVVEIDETANNAAEQAAQAQTTAQAAQTKAEQATADAEAAQKAADDAASAAEAAQGEADTAKAAATTAQGVADKAKADLEAAKADLATVKGRVDATEEDIATAEKAVETAQAAADTAKADAATAAQKATAAQSTADTAKVNAATAQTAANNASAQATAAQKAAEAAQGDATAAQATADEAKANAQAAQSTADTAKTNASTAQSKADAAAQAAQAAQTAADNADAKAAAAASDLATAKNNLAAVTSRVDATEAEIAEAEAAVIAAQAAADSAAANAATAQSTANTAKANAATAQTAANNAKTAADNAQKAADDAQDAADAAQAAVDSLAVRVTTAETKITQNSEEIALRATKTEVATTLGGYYTKKQTDAAITTKANEITSSVSATYSTKNEVAEACYTESNNVILSEDIIIGGTPIYFSKPVDMIADKIYFVYWNGVKYVCRTSEMDIDGLPIIAFGNFNDEEGKEPFYGFTLTEPIDGIYGMIQPRETGGGEKTVSIYGPAESVIDKTESLEKSIESHETRITQTESSITSHAASISSHGTRISTLEQNAEGFTVRLETVEADAIVSTVEQFYLSTSATALSGGSWSNSQSTWTNGKFIWRRTLVTYGDGSTAYTPSASGVCITGNTGATGATGPAGANGADGQMLYATCGTAAATAAKVATLASGTLTLKAGATVAVKFTYANNVSSPTLNVASTGAKSIRLNGAALTAAAYYWVAGAVVTFVYDGSYWNISDAAALSKANSAQSTANTANTTANTAVTNAATAQSTADSAAAAASAAQSTANTANSTANTAKTNAATAQSTANTAKNNAATAQSTANTARTEAANAAKTATNYLNFSSSGLVIGDMTASTLGRNVLIDSDSVDIRNGTTVLASFGANLIELGKNSTASSISLCGGVGSISYGEGPFDGDGNMFTLNSTNPVLIRSNVETELLSIAGTYKWSIIKAMPEQIHLETYYSVAQSDGTAVYSGTQLDLYENELYGLADTVQFVGRYGMTLQTVSGDIEIPAGNLVTTERIYANGGLRLGNGGQITGNTSTGKEITMLQMNASNYTMLGYGSYSNKIGATYVDGNAVYIRSNGDVNMTGHLKISGNLTMTSNTATFSAIELHRSTPYIDFHYGQSTEDYTSRIIEDASGRLHFVCTAGIRFSVTNENVELVTSTNSTYSAFFRPTTNAKCTLGDSSHRWYAVYASNGTIQTSDRREKENIIPIGIKQLMPSDDSGPDKVVDLHSELFDRLQPVQYNFIEGNKKICYGLIAQDVIEAMHEVGIGENELDLVHHDFWTDEKGDESETYGLGYTNLIALLIHEVQKLKKEVKTLKAS